MAVKMNMNDPVWVKLTPIGKSVQGVADRLKYSPEILGWSEWQLWDLMSVFGDMIYNGGDLPFETDIALSPPV